MKNMKIITIYTKIVIIFFAIVIMFSACEHNLEIKNSEELAYIKINCQNARTVFNRLGYWDRNAECVLSGIKDGSSEEVTIFRKIDYSSIDKGTFALGAGTWTFTLTVIVSDKTFTGTLKKTLTAGVTTSLEFELKAASEWATSIDINFLVDEWYAIKGMTAGLYDIATANPINGCEAESLSIIQKGSAKYFNYYKTEIPAGYYLFKANYYADSKCTIYVNTYESVVRVVPGNVSDAEINQLYHFGSSFSISYDLKGGEFVNNFVPPDSFSSYNVVKLPGRNDLRKDGYVFDGWYASYGSSESKIESVDNQEHNIEVYAKWLPGMIISPEDINSIDLSTEYGELTIVAVGNFQNKFNTLCNIIKSYQYEIILDMSEVTGIRKIPNEAFKSSSITNVNLPRTILGIGDSAFEECKDLIEIVIPEGCTSIGNKAFYNGENIDSVAVSIPYTITDIGTDAFKNTNVKYINYTGTIEQWCKRSWNSSTISSAYYLYIDEKELEGVEFGGNNGSISCGTDIVNFIGCDVTSINNYAFAGCISLKFVSICENVTKINSEAFKGCYNLNCAHISSETIETSAFSECLNLNTIEIFESVKSIGVNAFYHCTYLTAAHFRDSDNWYSKQYPTSTEETQVNLSNDAEAANLLKGGRYFYKKE